MDLTNLVSEIFGKYQGHVFAALAVIIRMQVKTNKNLEVHQKHCDGRCLLQTEINKNLREDIKDNEQIIFDLSKTVRLNSGKYGG